jgi:hypothetical protein
VIFLNSSDILKSVCEDCDFNFCVWGSLGFEAAVKCLETLEQRVLELVGLLNHERTKNQYILGDLSASHGEVKNLRHLLKEVSTVQLNLLVA